MQRRYAHAYVCVHSKRETNRIKYMEAVRQTSYDWGSNVMERPIIDANWSTQPTCSRKEFMDELARRVGSHYGLADIRDAQFHMERR